MHVSYSIGLWGWKTIIVMFVNGVCFLFLVVEFPSVVLHVVEEFNRMLFCHLSIHVREGVNVISSVLLSIDQSVPATQIGSTSEVNAFSFPSDPKLPALASSISLP